MCGGVTGCPDNDAVCQRDWIGFEAIAQLHSQIDDDHNGSLDRLESDEVSVLCVKKIHRLKFSDIFSNSLEFIVQILHAYYTFLSMIDYKFLFNYLQL